MKNPLVSIILPTYNRAKFLPRCLDTVFAQTYENWELIIIDDGSTDNTASVVEMYGDARVRYIYQQNQGVSAARNTGIARSRGEYIALLDSDDEWLPKKLLIQLRYMQENGFEICQTNETWYRKGRPVNQPEKYAKPEGWFFEASLRMCLISPSCVVFTRKVWEQIGPFDVHMPACEDYDMWLRACLMYPVGLVSASLTVKHGGRADQLSNAVSCADMYRIRALIKILQCGKLDTEQAAAALSELEAKVSIYRQGCEKRGKSEEAKRIWNLFCMVRNGNNIPLDVV